MDNLIKNYSRLHQDFIELDNIRERGFGKYLKCIIK